MDFLSGFLVKPKVSCEFQQKEEEILLLVRAHPITQIYWLINGLFIFFFLFIGNFFFPQFLNLNQSLFLNFLIIFFVFSYWWFNFLSWYFNVGVITNRRVIDIDFHSLIYKEVTSANLNKIEDITIKTGGFFQSFFNYGNVFIQTAGSEINIEFYRVPNPERVKEVVNNLLPKS